MVIFLSDNQIPFPGAKMNLWDTGTSIPLLGCVIGPDDDAGGGVKKETDSSDSDNNINGDGGKKVHRSDALVSTLSSLFGKTLTRLGTKEITSALTPTSALVLLSDYPASEAARAGERVGS